MGAQRTVPKPVVEHRPIPVGNLDPDAVKVVRRLVRHGHEAYLVGGCVRDLLLGCQPKDFDVATSAQPPELRKLFRNCRIIGRRFRLAHMLFREGKIIEVATFRRDPTADDDEDESEDLLLRRDNAYGEPHEDALRRDFTINALFYDLSRERIIDYADGLVDVERRLLRTIGSPDIRLQEDPVRLLRAIKFTARQDLGMHPELYEAAIRHRGLLARSAPARVFEEILRLLRGGAAHRSFWLAHEMGILAELLPELDDLLWSGWQEARPTWAALQAIDAMVRRGRRPSDEVLLTALLARPLVLATAEKRDQNRALREVLRPMAERLVIPRRLRHQIRQVLMAQRRLEPSGKRRRGRLETFAEAIEYHEVTLRVDGWSEPELDRRREALSRSLPRTPRKRPPPRRRSRGRYRGGGGRSNR